MMMILKIVCSHVRVLRALPFSRFLRDVRSAPIESVYDVCIRVDMFCVCVCDYINV